MILDKLYAYIPEPPDEPRPPYLPLSRHGWLLLSLILLLGAGLRLYALGRFSLWYDEGTTLMGANLVSKPWLYFNPNFNIEPPLYYFLSACWRACAHMLPSPPLRTEAYDAFFRLPSWFLGVLTVPLAFFTTRMLTRRDLPSYVAALFIAISPFQIYYAQELRAYTAYACLALGALLCLLSALETGRKTSWLGLVVLLSLGMYIHYFSVWVIAVFNVYFLTVLPWHKRKTPAWVYFAMRCAAAYTASLLSRRANGSNGQQGPSSGILPLHSKTA